jgi:TetR/AcrR family transcriptional repressor of nem operon
MARHAGRYRPIDLDETIVLSLTSPAGGLVRYDDNHKERTRARVLAEAAGAIQSKGAERVGVAEIMTGAGLTHGGFYAHFTSKDDLIAQAITHMFEDSYEFFLRHTEGREPADALSNYHDQRAVDRDLEGLLAPLELPAIQGAVGRHPQVDAAVAPKVARRLRPSMTSVWCATARSSTEWVVSTARTANRSAAAQGG